MPETPTWFLIPFRPLTGAEPRFASLGDGRLIATARRSTAEQLTDHLAESGIEAGNYRVTAADVRDLLSFNDVDDETIPDRVLVIEAQTTGLADLNAYVAELADELFRGELRRVARITSDVVAELDDDQPPW